MTDPTPAEALKPPLCPFCDQQTDWNVDDIDGWIASVSCSGCDMVGPMSEFKYDDPEEAKVDAFARWQRGFPPAAEERTASEPFGYWVEQRHAEPALLRKPAYIPEPSDLRTVTPLFATLPSPATDAGEVRTAPSEEWQPIETAPKDGTDFLAAWEDVERGRYVYGVIAWIDPRSDGLDWHEGDSIVGPPKYWRPLPAPPAAAIRGLAR